MSSVLLVMGGLVQLLSACAGESESEPAVGEGRLRIRLSAGAPTPAPGTCVVDFESRADRFFAGATYTPPGADVAQERAAFLGLWKGFNPDTGDSLTLQVTRVHADSLFGLVEVRLPKGYPMSAIGTMIGTTPFLGSASFVSQPPLNLKDGDPRFSFAMRDDLEAIDGTVEYAGSVLQFTLARCPV